MTVHGMGGIGKTALAFEIARQLEPEYARLGLLRHERLSLKEDLLNGVARAFQMAHPRDVSLGQVSRLIDPLGPALVLLDNTNADSRAVQQAVSKLLNACPQPPGDRGRSANAAFRGEACVRLEALAIPKPTDELSSILASPAVALFENRVKLRNPSFAVTAAIEQQLQIIDAGIAALPSWDREIVQCVADIAVKQLEAAVAYEAWSSSPIDYVAMNERLGGAVEAAAAGAGQAGGNGSETHSGASNTQAAIKTTPVLVAILKRHPSNYYRELWNANEAGFVSFWTSGARQLGLLPGTTAPSKQGPYDHQSFNEDDALP